MNTENFYKLPKDLARADGFISKKTGEAVKLSASGKIIYAYMLSKNEFFTETLKGQHYEAQATIASSCGLEYKACGNILRTLLEHEVLEGKKLRPNGEGQWRWYYYKVHSDLMLWVGDTKDFEIIKEERKVVDKPKVQAIPQTPQYEPHWDESDLPF